METVTRKDDFKRFLFADELVLNEDQDIAIFTDQKHFYLLKKKTGEIRNLEIIATQSRDHHHAQDLLDFGAENHAIFLFLYKESLYYGRQVQASDQA